jgi:hypothetical protein
MAASASPAVGISFIAAENRSLEGGLPDFHIISVQRRHPRRFPV